MPWWTDYLWAAEKLNCQPWDFDPDVPRGFWRRCALILASAEGEAHSIRERNQALLQGGPH